MTREEAIAVLEGLSDNPLFSNQHKAAFNIAIHDIKQRHDWDINNLILINKENYEPLEQEPCDKYIKEIDHLRKYIYKLETQIVEQEPILDKIRAEIEQLRLHKAQFLTNDNKVCIDSQAVLDIINKYKAESEEKK